MVFTNLEQQYQRIDCSCCLSRDLINPPAHNTRAQCCTWISGEMRRIRWWELNADEDCTAVHQLGCRNQNHHCIMSLTLAAQCLVFTPHHLPGGPGLQFTNSATSMTSWSCTDTCRAALWAGKHNEVFYTIMTNTRLTVSGRAQTTWTQHKTLVSLIS